VSEPLSDQAIEAMLAEKGFKVARRTIAKYRGVLKIAPSHQRRRD
jgi:RNA polymerase sigma-54 factor